MEWEIGREAWRDFALDTNVIFNSISRSVVLMEFKLSVHVSRKCVKMDPISKWEYFEAIIFTGRVKPIPG